MQRTVDQFNRSQNKIVVEYLPLSNVDRKALVATAGGDPPDVVGLWAFNVYSFADRDALQPFDDFIRAEAACGSLDSQTMAGAVRAGLCRRVHLSRPGLGGVVNSVDDGAALE